MARTRIIDEELNAVAAHLRGRRQAILHAWRVAADADPQLTAVNALPHSQFNDHIPDVLDVFERKLQAWPEDPQPLDQKQKKDAAAHGLQRWHQGYRLREVTREWGHLQLVLLDELERYASERAHRSPEAMPVARRILSELCISSVSDSTAEYFELEKLDAAGHVRDLARTLNEERKLQRDRAELWRQAAHDLRGHVGAVVNATTGLSSSAAPAPIREKFLLLLQRSTSSLHMMLDDVMNLARLQAGQERLDIKQFDAARLLRELCEELHTQAQERDLYLESSGCDSLIVEGDAVKTRRVAQNLLINALKYTREGGVTVNLGDSKENDPDRWMFTVHDTGPGFHAGPGAPLVSALKAATAASHEIDRKAGVDPESVDTDGSAIDTDRREVNQPRGEGIGLSIVKRLSDLLNATIELESSAELGTTFRVILPRRYQPEPSGMSPARAVLAVLVVGCMGSPAAAHDTWLQPRRTAVTPGTIAQIDLTSSDKFAVFDTAITPDRIGAARARLNGKTFDIRPGAPEKKSLELRVALPDPGVATLWLSLAPKSIEMNRKQVQHYLDEIDAPQLLTQAWYAGKGAKPWREVYSKHAKTFVRVGRPKADRSWSEPVGMALEIIPEKDPTTLRTGDEFPVRVLKNGTPLIDFSLGIMREGRTNRAFKKTDAAGRAVFKLGRAGKWLLRGTELRSSNKPGIDWESDFTTLLFEVQ